MVHLFFDQHSAEHQEEEKLSELLSLLQVYNLSSHDNQEQRAEHLQNILNHLENMEITPSLRHWIEQDLTEHLHYYEITSTSDFTKSGPL